MGKLLRLGRFVGFSSVVMLIAMASLSGCQLAPTVTAHQLIRHQAIIDFAGLNDPITVEALKTSIAIPVGWDASGLRTGGLFNHQQWRSPSHANAVGVVFIKLPIPLPASTLAWFAKREYAKKSDDGRLIAEWTDSLGRPWFEAENSRYHARGCAMVRGTDAWILYYGFKRDQPPKPDELLLAARSLDTCVPADVRKQQERQQQLRARAMAQSDDAR